LSSAFREVQATTTPSHLPFFGYIRYLWKIISHFLEIKMDRLDSMALFLDVLDMGSLSAVARARSIPLATLSRKISDLEAHLGTRLLQRAGRGLVPTDVGVDFATACRRILDDVAEAERVAGGELFRPKGSLIITSPVVFGRLHVLPVIADFLKMYPDIRVRLIQSDRIVDLAEEHVDLAVRIGTLRDSGLAARTIGTLRQVLCASPDYLSQHGRPTRPEELENHFCVSFQTLTSGSNWTFRSADADVQVEIHPRLTVNTAEAAVDAAISGLGLTRVLSYQVDDALRAGRLETFMEDFEGPAWPVSLMYPKRGSVPKKIRVFIDFAADRLKSRLSTLGQSS
jgi:DNA-binding transcriptional LysR family regulator